MLPCGSGTSLDTSAAGTYSAVVSIPSLPPVADANENPFVFDIRAKVIDTLIVDDHDASFDAPGLTNFGTATFQQPQGFRFPLLGGADDRVQAKRRHDKTRVANVIGGK